MSTKAECNCDQAQALKGQLRALKSMLQEERDKNSFHFQEVQQLRQRVDELELLQIEDLTMAEVSANLKRILAKMDI